jgi:saccharopine dehydrogenase-like NADP-dependent oxidoreductase
MGKRILILGVGAQGSTVAQRMDEEAKVDEILCADYDTKAVEQLTRILKKGKGRQIDASDKAGIAAAAQGVDLIVNALPLQYGDKVLEAAVDVRANYQDFAATEALDPDWVKGIERMYREYGPRFAKNDRLAVVGTGSAPGLICAATRQAVRHLDACDTIYNIVYEGVVAKRFLPFWWSPVTALGDMGEDAYAFEDGRIVRTTPFSKPIYRKYEYMDEEVKLVEHAHDEPVYMGYNAKEYFKGARNIYFKYGGAGVDFSEPLFRAGLLSKQPEEIKGQRVAPFDMILKHIPPAPKYKEEIQQILDEGLLSDTGCMVVEAYGKKDGADVLVEVHVFAPGLVESFEKAGISAEMYLTGQGGALFTKMFVEDKYGQTGLITSDMLSYDEVDYYFAQAAALGITLETKVVKR